MLKKFLSKFFENRIVGCRYRGFIDYPGVGKITDNDVCELVLNHSRFIDRLNPYKMVEMSLFGQCILMGLFENLDPDDASWKFYGKHSINNMKDWG